MNLSSLATKSRFQKPVVLFFCILLFSERLSLPPVKKKIRQRNRIYFFTPFEAQWLIVRLNDNCGIPWSSIVQCFKIAD